jgi:hypothetical protein
MNVALVTGSAGLMEANLLNFFLQNLILSRVLTIICGNIFLEQTDQPLGIKKGSKVQ